MKFFHRVLHDLEGAQENFQQLEILLRGRYGLSSATATAQAAWGTGTLTWAGGTPSSGITVITHGLGATPGTVQVTGQVMSDGQGQAAVLGAFSAGSTSFSVQARISGNYYNPAAGVTCAFYWTAIG